MDFQENARTFGHSVLYSAYTQSEHQRACITFSWFKPIIIEYCSGNWCVKSF